MSHASAGPSRQPSFNFQIIHVIQHRHLRPFFAAGLLAGSSLGLPSLAEAALVVQLVNGTETVTCADNAACDSSPESGNLLLTNQSIGD